MRFGILTKCRNELNIIEFMNHYYDLGFEYIIFCDDSDTNILQNKIGFRFQNKYKIFCTKEKKNDINASFSECIISNREVISSILDYVFIIDLDEYLFLDKKKFKSIQDVFNFFRPFDILKINWLLFGNSNIKNCKNNNNLKNIFIKSDLYLNHHVKSIFCTKILKCCKELNPHYPICYQDDFLVKNIKNEITKLNPFEENLIQTEYYNISIYLAHYVVQSTQRFLERRFLDHNELKLKSFYYQLDTEFPLLKIINIISKNKHNIIDSIHYDKPFIKLLNHPPMREYLNKIKIFFKQHNKNIIDNLDLFE